MQNLALTNEDWLNIERELASRSLAEFVKLAWPVLEPGQKYIHGWHIDAICEHLEAVTAGDITRLLINVPPGTMKSLLTNVFWPAWEWGPKGTPQTRIIGASHEQGLAIRDNLKMRRLVESEWYQTRWPTNLTSDQNAKTNFENGSTGFRAACAVASMTGRRGDRVIWDDPHSVEAAISDAHRTTALRVFQETLQTRLNNPDQSAIIIVMQRLHEDDVAGHIIQNELPYEKLILPMEYELERHCTTSIGFSDPRKEEGELLFPDRFPPNVVDEYKQSMGSYGYAGQMQQRPAPRSGGFFAWEKLEIVRALPKIKKAVRAWDKAGSKGAGAYTAGVKMGLGEDGYWYVMDVVRGQWAAPERERIIKQTAEADGGSVHIWIEQEPGSGGKESAESTIRNLAGFVCKAEHPTGEKAVRAEPYSVQVEANNIKLLAADWNKDFIDEHKTFPNGKYKDQIDAASYAFNKLARPAVNDEFACVISVR